MFLYGSRFGLLFFRLWGSKPIAYSLHHVPRRGHIAPGRGFGLSREALDQQLGDALKTFRVSTLTLAPGRQGST